MIARVIRRPIHVAWVALLAGCTAPPAAPEKPAILHVGTEAGILDWSTDLVSPARIRFSVTLFGPSLEVHRVECDIAWNEESVQSAPLEQQCTGDVEFQVTVASPNTNLFSSHHRVGLLMTLPNYPTQVLFVGEYEPAESPSFRKLGTISWPSHEDRGDIRWHNT